MPRSSNPTPSGRSAATRGAAFCGIVVLGGFIADQGSTLWNEIKALRDELDRSEYSAVVGYTGISPKFSTAARPVNWARDDGGRLALWGGWDPAAATAGSGSAAASSTVSGSACRSAATCSGRSTSRSSRTAAARSAPGSRPATRPGRPGQRLLLRLSGAGPRQGPHRQRRDRPARRSWSSAARARSAARRSTRRPSTAAASPWASAASSTRTGPCSTTARPRGSGSSATTAWSP